MSLPTAHHNSAAMVRTLVSYMDSDKDVQREVEVNLHYRLPLGYIAKIREEQSRRTTHAPIEDPKPGDAHQPMTEFDSLIKANNEHVAAIMAERRRVKLRVMAA